MFNNQTVIEKVAVYLRVSTEDQAKEGFSLAAQEKKLKAYCQSRTPEWKISEIYIDDGYSGRNTRKRPAYQKMFQDIDLWDGVLCLKMDRIHRNSKNFLKMMEELKKKDKEFISSQESFDTSNAMGRFVMYIIQLIAQLESEQNAERVTMAMIQKAQDLTKGYVGHRLASGYTLSNGNIKEVPEQLKIIKEVYKLYSEGKSMPWIEKYYGYKNENGKKKLNIPYSQIRYWLNNLWYVGYEQWGNCFKKIPLDPVISVDLWNTVQTRKRNAKGGRRLKAFILQGLPDAFTLSDQEMRDFGFSMDIIQNQVK